MTTSPSITTSSLDLTSRVGHAYVGGQWVPGAAGERDVVNPVDGTILTRVTVSSTTQCLDAVDAAARAQAAWSARPARERAEILRRAYELMCRDEEELARLITLENGKALTDARAEVRYAAEFFRWFAEEAVRVPGDLRRSPAGQNWIMVSHEPVGVCLLITPWNFPAAMATRKIAPALAAGCAVVLKPAMEPKVGAPSIQEAAWPSMDSVISRNSSKWYFLKW